MMDWRGRLSDRLRPVRAWFGGLSAREQRIVTGGGIAAAVLLFIGAGVLPLYAATGKLADRIERKREDLAWMRSVAAELGVAPRAAAQGSAVSLIVVVDQTARESGLGAAVTGSQPSGNGGLRVRIEQAPFRALVGWLAVLEREHRIGVESANIDRSGTPGLVNASLVFTSAR